MQCKKAVTFKFPDRKTETEEEPDNRNGATQLGESRHPVPGGETPTLQTDPHRNERGPVAGDRQRPAHPNRNAEREPGQVPDGQGRPAHGAGLDVGRHRGFNPIFVSGIVRCLTTAKR